MLHLSIQPQGLQVATSFIPLPFLLCFHCVIALPICVSNAIALLAGDAICVSILSSSGTSLAAAQMRNVIYSDTARENYVRT